MMLMTVGVAGAILSFGAFLFTVRRAAAEKARNDEAWRQGASLAAGEEDWFAAAAPANNLSAFEDEEIELDEERLARTG